MKQAQRSPQPEAPSKGTLLRTMIGTAVGVSATGSAFDANAQTADIQLPTVSVEGAAAPTRNSGYQTSMPSLDKLTQPLLDTPQSVAVVPRQLLDDQGITTLRDALRDVPGVSLAAGEGGQQGDNLSIRGFNAQNDFYLDGMRDFGSYTRDPFNLAIGRGAEGPGLRAVRPRLHRRHHQPGVQAGARSPPSPSARCPSAPTAPSAARSTWAAPCRALTGTAVRLNAMVDDAGIAGRDVARYRRFGIAPQVAFGLGSDTRLKLSYLHQQGYDTPDFGIPWLNGRPAPVARQNFYGYAEHDHFRTDVDIGTARLEHDFNDSITLASQTRYGSYRRDLRVTEPLITGYTASQDIVNPNVPLGSIKVSRHIIGLNSTEGLFDHQDDATFHFSTGPLEHTVVTGIEVLRQTSTPTRVNLTAGTTSLLYPDSSTPFTAAQPITSIQTAIANNYAAYVTDTVKIGPMFEVIGGWRFDRYDSTFKQIIKPAVYVSRDDDMPTWRAALVFKPVDYASVYAAYGTSFDPSAEALSLSASTAAVAPEKSRNYEVGAKIDLMERRLSLTTAFYDLAKTNVRETEPDRSHHVGPGRQLPRARVRGGRHRPHHGPAAGVRRLQLQRRPGGRLAVRGGTAPPAAERPAPHASARSSSTTCPGTASRSVAA